MYAQGKFGIEYNPNSRPPRRSGVGWVLFAVALAGAIVLTISTIRRIGARNDNPLPGDIAPAAIAANPPPAPAATNAVVAPLPPVVAPPTDDGSRSTKVRNLLMRLRAAEEKGNVEMMVSTIEQLRELPSATDLKDKYTPILGALNFRRLFVDKSRLWTTQVKVRRGDSASRIAFENGSTLASLKKLNGDVERLKVGQTLTVMNHPRFVLVIGRRTRTADLCLNGKFFKQYELTEVATGDLGSFKLEGRLRSFLSAHGISMRPEDRAELEMLLPPGVEINISEFGGV